MVGSGDAYRDTLAVTHPGMGLQGGRANIFGHTDVRVIFEECFTSGRLQREKVRGFFGIYYVFF